MSDATPTTEQVRGAYLMATVTATGCSETQAVKVGIPQFHRWLAAHDADVASRVLKEFAGSIDVEALADAWFDASWKQRRADEREWRRDHA